MQKSRKLPKDVVVGQSHGMALWKKTVLAGAVFVFIVSGVFLVRGISNQNKRVCVPGSSLFGEAAQAIDKQDSSALQDIVKTIEQDETYNDSGSCLYLVMEHYMFEKNEAKVKQHLARFKELSKENLQINEALLVGDIKAPADIIQRVELFLNNQADFDVNRIYL